jgi:hypothetical protein
MVAQPWQYSWHCRFTFAFNHQCGAGRFSRGNVGSFRADAIYHGGFGCRGVLIGIFVWPLLAVITSVNSGFSGVKRRLDNRLADCFSWHSLSKCEGGRSSGENQSGDAANKGQFTEWHLQMKKLHIAPYCIAFAVGNSFVPLILGKVVEIMKTLYQGRFGWPEMLAGSTRLALELPSWFYVFTALSLLACLGLFIRKVSISLLVHWLLAVSFLECIALLFFAVGICVSLAPPLEKVGN